MIRDCGERFDSSSKRCFEKSENPRCLCSVLSHIERETVLRVPRELLESESENLRDEQGNI